MCGIAGIVNFKPIYSNRVVLNKLLTSIKHRGPDGQGTYFNHSISLGMRRLAIIDVLGGKQPIYNEDASLVIVGNGEIYNYRELNHKLKHHHFRTGSDIETALHLYEQFGETFVSYLRGMYALAIYDKARQKLVLVRDRMGEKPLYYFHDRDVFIFSSELKSLLRVLPRTPEINNTSIRDYLYYYYIPEPQTAFKNIHKLPPAYSLTLDLVTGKMASAPYWQPKQPSLSHQNLVHSLRTRLETAVKLNLTSDVPVALSLSGGIDSASILALASRQYSGNLSAFTVGYDHPGVNDETPVAASLAKHFGVRHYTDKITTREFVRDFPKLVYCCDDPVSDIAAYAIFRVSDLVHRKGYKVLLSGLGGDELFWGYPWVKEQLFKHLDSSSSWSLYSQTTPFRQMNRISKFILEPSFLSQYGPPPADMPTSLKTPTSIAFHALKLLHSKWLVSNCLTLSDRLSMANSVESRAPLLDYPLVELATGARKNLSDFNLPPKYWFKKAMQNYLPAEYLNLPKRGFTPPVYSWLLELLPRYAHLLSDGFLVENKILRYSSAKILSLFWRSTPPLWPLVYQLLVLETWGRMNIYRQSQESL